MQKLTLRLILCFIIIIIIIVLSCFFFETWQSYNKGTLSEDMRCTDVRNHIWDRELDLDKDGRVKIQWNFTKEEITMLVIGRTKGYVGIGFTHTLDMVDSDIIVGWFTDGQLYLKDLHGVKNGIPLEDDQEDYHLLFGGENETHTWFCFNRKLDTKDKNDIKITMSTFHVLWAISEKDPLDSGFTEFDYHGKNRGMKKVLLLFLSLQQPTSTSDVEAFDVRMDKRRVQRRSSDLTYSYRCKFFRVPNFGEMHHFIGMEMLLNPVGGKYIHHVNLYSCEVGVSFHREIFNYECFTTQYLEDILCKKPIIGTAFGENTIFVPSHIGIPFGSTDDHFMYLRMEIHYDLEQIEYPFTDDSGLRLYHTSKLRAHSVVPLGLMPTPMYIIPPKALDFPCYAFASPKCTKATFPKEGVHMTGVYMHSHRYVDKVTFYHFRNGKEINRISEEYFDYNFQRIRWLKEEIVVLQNDIIIYECVHNTTDRDAPMYPFFGAKDDMCLFVSFIYPAIPYSFFMSSIIPSELHNFFNEVPDVNIYNNNSWASLGLQVYHSLGVVLHALNHNWTQKEIKDFRNLFKHGLYSSVCHFDNFRTSLIAEQLRLPNISSY